MDPVTFQTNGPGDTLTHTQDDKGLHVTFPAKLPHDLAVAVKIEGLQIQGFKPDLSILFRGGKATLSTSLATLHGPGIGKETKDGGKPNIGFWDDPSATVSWEVNIPKAGAYRVRGRFAAMRQSALTVRAGDATLSCKPPVTGARDKFQTIDLGTLTIARPGRLEVKAVPVKANWAAVNLSWLELTQSEK